MINRTLAASRAAQITSSHTTHFPRPKLPLVLRTFALAVATLIGSQSFAETTVKVLSLGTDRADLMINGFVLRMMRTGQTSPEGVKLISATATSAEVEVNGKRQTLRSGQVAAATIVLNADSRGHFRTTIKINGVATEALVDTGASDVTINRDEAKRMGINYTRGERITTSTANGDIKVWKVKLATVKVGEIELRDVQGSVIDGGPEKLRQTLLGMSFLSQLDMQRAGSSLTLVKQ